MKSIPSFIGIVIMSLGVALVYVGLHDWTPKLGLKLPTIEPATSGSAGGGGGYG